MEIPAYPKGIWVFNPFAWQLLFVFGAWCALGGAQRLSRWIEFARRRSRWPLFISLSRSFITMRLVFPAAGGAGAEIRQRRHLSDRQDQSRRAAHFAFPVAGGDHGLVRAARLAGAHARRSFGRRSCAASIRSRSSASACFCRLPGISCSPRYRTACRCRSRSASPASPSWLARPRWFRGIRRVERRGSGPRPPAATPGYAGGEA